MARRRSTAFYATTALFLGAAAALVYGAGPGGWFESGTAETPRGATVQRGPLRITVTQRGNLSAKNAVRLFNEIEGRTTILELVEEGTFVEAGTVVARLDVSAQRDARTGQEIKVENARARVTKARQQIEIQKSQNASDIARAQQDLDFAHQDLEKYLEGEYPKLLQEADEAILIAEQQLAQAKNTLDWSRRLHDNGFLQRTRLEEDELAYEQARIRLEAVKRDKELLIKYDHPKQLATLKAAVEEAERELERVKLQAAARLVDFEAELTSAEAELELEMEKLEKINRMIEKADLVAPVAGMVVYARERSRWGQGDPIQKGTEVRERQEIISIPQPGGMLVEASVHESVLKKVKVGQPCTVRVDALPGQEFRGRVQFIAQVPDSANFWANPNQRLYTTEIALEDSSPELRPGMSCEVEILVQEIPDTLYIPILAVHYSGGRPVVFVDGESGPREVEIGESSDKWVQVLSGLQEGEVVLLAPPADFTPEPAPEQERPETPAGMAGYGEGSGAPAGGAGKGGAWPGAAAGRPRNEGSRPGQEGGAGAWPEAAGGEGRSPGGRRPGGPKDSTSQGDSQQD